MPAHIPPTRLSNIAEEKWCIRRGHFVSRDGFDKNQSARDGLQIWCRDCDHEYKRSLDREPRNQLEQLKQQLGLRVTGVVSKVCRGCTRNLPRTREHFHCRERKGHDPYWYPWCRDCKSQKRDRERKAKVTHGL